jgi:hypothetical protein
MDKHKFITNIKQLSESQDDNEVSKEWEYYKDETLATVSGKCICNHKVKYVYYYVNILNGNIIQVGDVCRKKYIELEDVERHSMIYIKDALMDIKDVGKYGNITDVLEYENDIRTKVMQKIIKDIDTENTISKLDKVLEDVKCLADIILGTNSMSIFLKENIKKINDKKQSILEEERIKKEKELEDERIKKKQMKIIENQKKEKELELEEYTIKKNNTVSRERALIEYEIKRLVDTIERKKLLMSNKINNGFILTDEIKMYEEKEFQIINDAIEKYKKQLY